MKSARLSRVLARAAFALLLAPLTLTLPAHAQTSAPTAPLVSTYAPPRDSTVLHSTFVDFDSLATSGPRQVFDNPSVAMDKVEVHVTTLAPGKESHPVHRHPWEEIIYIRSGQVDFTINGTVHHAGPGGYAFFASNDPHNARNVGTEPATYYVVNFVSDVASSAAQANAPSAAQQNQPGKFGSAVIDTNSLPVIATPTGSRSVVVQSQPTVTFLALETHITRLDPGKQTTPDRDPNDEVCILREGQVEVTVNGISSRMNAGSLMYWAPTDQRNFRNIGTTRASYLVIRATSDKSPRPPAPSSH
ncbi:MAG TPA: cupin domain-containing protein [Acidobacteriaceae bacterium]|nr:cupin domain-containing protein [Acidobacteriaceae bacterium]